MVAGSACSWRGALATFGSRSFTSPWTNWRRRVCAPFRYEGFRRKVEAEAAVKAIEAAKKFTK
jgi:hypothetical protein